MVRSMPTEWLLGRCWISWIPWMCLRPGHVFLRGCTTRMQQVPPGEAMEVQHPG